MIIFGMIYWNVSCHLLTDRTHTHRCVTHMQNNSGPNSDPCRTPTVKAHSDKSEFLYLFILFVCLLYLQTMADLRTLYHQNSYHKGLHSWLLHKSQDPHSLSIHFLILNFCNPICHLHIFYRCFWSLGWKNTFMLIKYSTYISLQAN